MAQANERASHVVIVSATRTAIGRFGGALGGLSAPDLGATVISEALHRAGVTPDAVDEVLMGNVLQAGLGQNPARQATIRAGLPIIVGATTVNKVCGSGLKAAMLGAAMIRAGDAQIIVAGGMESMTRAPYLLLDARAGYRLGHGCLVDAMLHDGLWCAIEDQHMGEAAEWIAEHVGLSRDQLDAYALRSHERAVAAAAQGRFADEIVAIPIPKRNAAPTLFDADECPRSDTSFDQLARLAPAFCADGLVTAGNASSIADGAAAMVLMSAERAEALGLTPMARIVAYAQAAVEPKAIFTAPPIAITRVLARAGLALHDIELFEINEAFAAQTLANLSTLDLDEARVNVHGGAIALGHPIGASGARVLVTLLHALRARGGASAGLRGLAALCLGGGEAVAMIVETV
jgi:acetyl-CoA C-acetyltransferase